MLVTKTGGHLIDERGYEVTPLSYTKYKDEINNFPEGSKITIDQYWDRWDIDTHQTTILKGNCITFSVEKVKEETSNYNNDEGDVSDANNGDSESN